MKKAIVAAAAIVLTACVSALASTAYTLSPAELELVKQGAAAAADDPSSATFGEWFPAAISDGVVTVCGTMNSKNGVGGLTGYKRFAGELSGGSFTMIARGGDQRNDERVMGACARAGVKI